MKIYIEDTISQSHPLFITLKHNWSDYLNVNIVFTTTIDYIKANGTESQEVLELRIVHKILHGMNLPTDDILKYKHIFGWWDRFLWWYYGNKKSSDMPYFQRKFYKYLLTKKMG